MSYLEGFAESIAGWDPDDGSMDAEYQRLRECAELAIKHRDDYETCYIEAGIEIRRLKARVAELETMVASPFCSRCGQNHWGDACPLGA